MTQRPAKPPIRSRRLAPFAPLALAGLLTVALCGQALAHGDVVPQPVDTTGLEKLGETWRDSNPYRGNPRAVEIGASAFNQNCARCHGLGAVSGGIAPDLRYLEKGDGGDEWFKERVTNGSIRNGVTYMPQFGEALGQEALWSIRSWLETVHEE
ncbi:cytochrome c-550 PedF [Azospirillum sp. TSA6c]|uniref:cytochrome c-550 PedF n=1 Tax=Azospirillum sp. TSA6c TaxID=709813 RepID=UPI000D646971|nr:cytochrome c-550 PedF [Azospirillum sp. TSA6c]